MILTLLSKMVGFGKEVILSYYYGASNISDAFLISLTIPNVIFAIFISAIRTTYMPILSSINSRSGIKSGIKFTNNIINLLFILCTFFICLLMFFTSPIVKVFASGFEGDTLRLAINLTRITLMSVYVLMVVELFKTFLQVNDNFIIPAISSIPMNMVISVAIYLSTVFNYTFLAWGKVIGLVATLATIIPYVRKNGYTYMFSLNIKSEEMRRMIYLVIPTMIGISVDQINKLVDRTLASQISIGGISVLNYAEKLNSFIVGVFVTSIVTVFYAKISKLGAEGNTEELKNEISKNILGINILLVPATVGAMIFSKEIVSLLFERGAFDSSDVTLTSYALICYSFGMIGFGLREVFTRVFYSLGDTRTPVNNAAIGMMLNIVLNFVLSRFMGISGIALATSVASIVTALLLISSLRKKIGILQLRKVIVPLLKISLASIIMGLISKLVFENISLILYQHISLMLAVLSGGFTYTVTAYLLKIDEMKIIKDALIRKVKFIRSDRQSNK